MSWLICIFGFHSNFWFLFPIYVLVQLCHWVTFDFLVQWGIDDLGHISLWTVSWLAQKHALEVQSSISLPRRSSVCISCFAFDGALVVVLFFYHDLAFIGEQFSMFYFFFNSVFHLVVYTFYVLVCVKYYVCPFLRKLHMSILCMYYLWYGSKCLSVLELSTRDTCFGSWWENISRVRVTMTLVILDFWSLAFVVLLYSKNVFERHPGRMAVYTEVDGSVVWLVLSSAIWQYASSTPNGNVLYNCSL